MKVVLLHEKHGIIVYVAQNDEELLEVYKKIIRDRNEEGYYEEEDNIDDLLKETKYKWLQGFLMDRNNYEYERIEVTIPENYR